MKESLPMYLWAAEDLPTSKAEVSGYESLSNVELLSILLGSGYKDKNAVDLSREILYICNNRLQNLARLDMKTLSGLKGMGKTKHARIMAAMELGKRRQSEDGEGRADLGTATRIYNHMIPLLQDKTDEEFWILLMNQRYGLIKKECIANGGLTECLVDIRVIMRECVLNNATVLAVCHNHPSGNVRPSKQDNELTVNIQNACKLMRIHFLDHLIITDGQYYSYFEQGNI